MALFKVNDVNIVVKVQEYHIEAETAEEALDKYCNELAGSIMPAKTYTRGLREGDKADVIVEPNPIDE
jgi:hypothetical protein